MQFSLSSWQSGWTHFKQETSSKPLRIFIFCSLDEAPWIDKLLSVVASSGPQRTRYLDSDVTLNEPEGCVMTRRARYVMSQRSVFAQRTCLFWWRKLIYSCSLLRGRKPVTSMYIFKGLWWVCVCVGVCLWMIRHCALPTPVFFFCYSGCLLTLCLCCPPTASNNPSSLSQTPGEACVSVICHWVMNGCTFMGIGSF